MLYIYFPLFPLPVQVVVVYAVVYLFFIITNTPQSSSKYPPGVTKERLLQALPTLGILNEHQWNTLPDGDDVLLVNNVLALNNISMFSAATQLGKVSNRT